MICAQYIPETYMSGEDDDDVTVHVKGVPAARRKLVSSLVWFYNRPWE